MDIVEFLTAELETDVAVHIARHDPARVLADVAAKRAIICAYREASQIDHLGFETDPEAQALHGVIHLLVQQYSDHPDFDPAWLAVASA